MVFAPPPSRHRLVLHFRAEVPSQVEPKDVIVIEHLVAINVATDEQKHHFTTSRGDGDALPSLAPKKKQVAASDVNGKGFWLMVDA